MLIHRQSDNIILSSEITPREIVEHRRRFMKQLAVGAAGSAGLLEMLSREAFAQNPGAKKLAAVPNSNYQLPDLKTPYKDATTYNNYYEFGTDKSQPAQTAGSLRTHPWTVSIEGEINKPMKLDLDGLMKLAALEERVYRHRCVEGWSMVVPWIGFSLSNLIKKVEPNGNAKYIEFTTLADKTQMPGLSADVLNWPYVEGLRMDEAMHPLAMLTFGMYGEVLPNQNGAPVRVNLPWKYGFKSAKSIVKIRFTSTQPKTAWNQAAPGEYGFYSNVNPNVDHPRWSQSTERRLGEDGFFTKKRKTLMFNGYNEVASLYNGMDLKKFY